MHRKNPQPNIQRTTETNLKQYITSYFQPVYTGTIHYSMGSKQTNNPAYVDPPRSGQQARSGYVWVHASNISLGLQHVVNRTSSPRSQRPDLVLKPHGDSNGPKQSKPVPGWALTLYRKQSLSLMSGEAVKVDSWRHQMANFKLGK